MTLKRSSLTVFFIVLTLSVGLVSVISPHTVKAQNKILSPFIDNYLGLSEAFVCQKLDTHDNLILQKFCSSPPGSPNENTAELKMSFDNQGLSRPTFTVMWNAHTEIDDVRPGDGPYSYDVPVGANLRILLVSNQLMQFEISDDNARCAINPAIPGRPQVLTCLAEMGPEGISFSATIRR